MDTAENNTDVKTVISVRNLSKAFPVYNTPKDVILEFLTGKNRNDLFWALRDISFTVKEKQRVGIVGLNGSGKSTLLKILTGNLPPTSGKVIIDGRISALLSLNSLLNLQETGIENIRFNLIINGCKQSEIAEITEDIIDFTELGHFIYKPLITYSSGMYTRLSFAIATALKPDILVIDEILSVGDAFFAGKAMKRMLDLCNRGNALIFVSHSTSAVRMLCDTVIWLENGNIRNMGSTEDMLRLYEEDNYNKEDIEIRDGGRRQKYLASNILYVSEIETGDIYRVRLQPDNNKLLFKDIHYVRKIILSYEGIDEQNIDLGISDMNKTDVYACLDVVYSEWGTFYTKETHNSRILCNNSGKNKGGQILIKYHQKNINELNIKMRIEVSSLSNKEKLTIAFADKSTGTWKKVDNVFYEVMEDGWVSITSDIKLPIVSKELQICTANKISNENKPAVEIQSAEVIVNGRVLNIVKERQPFIIRIQICAHKNVPSVNVSIKITRSDGVYMFWQSTGMNEEEGIKDLTGYLSISFLFDNNYFPGGEYSVTVACSDGWDYKNNYPYKMVYDRKISCLMFTVIRELERLDFGAINMLVPVRYSKTV
ncbi:ABC transporter ATP-binding protein [Candidatus Magnetominusculus xianensis]|nr:ABC transporter ATP-binding protein [Candidatus Magnetominusculus xianensis]MBF0404348.1 ABC transporter ATP-binding protein [Nitrospirota bacterium]